MTMQQFTLAQLTVFVAGDPFGLNPVLVEKGVIPAPVASYAYALGNPSRCCPTNGNEQYCTSSNQHSWFD